MKESSGKTKKVSKGVRRVRSLRNMVMMVLVCVLMLSAATYAWFTLSDTARITSLTMTVGEESALLIADDKDRAGSGEPGTYDGSLVFGENGDGDPKYLLIGKLLPASLASQTGEIMKPDYNEAGEVEQTLLSIENSNESTNEVMKDGGSDGDYYYYKTTFYLKNGGTEPNVTVRLKAPSNEIENNGAGTVTASDGTYMVNKQGEIGARAMRIRLRDEGNGVIIYQPLSNITTAVNSESAIDLNQSRTTAEITDQQKYDGTFVKEDNQRGTLSVSNGDGTRITMEIWFEGTDPYCCNEIMSDVIQGQIAFEIVPTTP